MPKPVLQSRGECVLEACGTNKGLDATSARTQARLSRKEGDEGRKRWERVMPRPSPTLSPPFSALFLEIHLRCITIRGVRDLEVLARFRPDDLRRDHDRETSDIRVVLLNRLVVIGSRNRDPVFSAGQFIL